MASLGDQIEMTGPLYIMEMDPEVNLLVVRSPFQSATRTAEKACVTSAIGDSM
jgi:hypothetical protein